MIPTLRRYDNPVSALRDFDRVVSQLWSEGDATHVGAGTFAVDIREQDDALIVEAELPGYSKDQIEVNVEQGVLTIEARRAEHSEAGDEGDGKGVRRHVAERVTHVTRRFSLPPAYDTTSVEATLQDGVLTLTLPKRDEVKPRKITVK